MAMGLVIEPMIPFRTSFHSVFVYHWTHGQLIGLEL